MTQLHIAQSSKHRLAIQRQRGFTIVELLIVIVVIAILAAISIVAYSGIQERARVSSTKSGQQQILTAIMMARTLTGKTLTEITGSSDSRQSKAAADAALDAISAASGADLSNLKSGDGWGNYYRIDENELEQSSTDCRQDTIQIAGRSDLTVSVPLSKAPCV